MYNMVEFMLRKGEVFAAAPPHIAYCPPHACHLTHPAHLPPAHAAAHRTPHTSPDSWPPPAAHRTGHNRRPACSASAPCLFPRCRAPRFPAGARLSHARCPPGRTTAPLPCRPRLMPPHTVPRLMPTACTSTAQPPPAEPTAGAHRCPLPPAHARCSLPAAPAALL